MEIKEILLLRKEDKNSFLESFIFEPTHFDEKKLGKLIILGKIKNSLAKNSPLLNYFGAEMKRSYYSFLKKTPSFAFKKLSERARDFLENFKKRKISIFNLDIFLGALLEKNFIFTGLGEISFFIKRGKQILNFSKKFSFFEPFKEFEKVEIQNGDFLFLSCPGLISEKKIKKYKNSLFSFLKKEKKFLKIVNPQETLLLLIFLI